MTSEEQRPRRPEEDDPRPRVVVGLLTDPGLSTRVAHQVAGCLADTLATSVNDRVRWAVEVRREPVEVEVPDAELLDAAREEADRANWELAICLTDVPLRRPGSVVLARARIADRVALVSLPALGALRLRRRARDLVVALVEVLAAAVGPRCHRSLESSIRALVPRPAHAFALDDHGSAVEVLLPQLVGLPRLLAGMVRVNQPWRLALGLSRALSSALTGSAFALLYPSIWQHALALGPLRLATVTVSAIGALAVWLIVGHQLWERRSGPIGRHRDGVRLRNAGTALTVGIGALVFFLALYALNLATAAVVIPPGFLARHIDRAVDWPDYLTVALMATVLGTVAGAIGSGLEDDNAVREATYGYRHQWRQRQAGRDGTG
jgi:hypothetical protein